MVPHSKKRSRDDSELGTNSPESKRVNPITESDPNPPRSEKSGHDSVAHSPGSTRGESEIDSSEIEHIPDDILDILDESETVNGREPAIEDLDSVMKSFEEEIHHNSINTSPPPVVLDLKSDPGESQPDLGCLLEASDDELGLPPANERTANDEQAVDLTVTNSSNAIELGNMLELENEFSGYDSFEFVLSESTGAINNNMINASSSGDFVTVDGLFDYPELSDFSGLTWRPESLPAL